eukprot:scaffold88451_cov50-Attheya_sp.AAC.4
MGGGIPVDGVAVVAVADDENDVLVSLGGAFRPRVSLTELDFWWEKLWQGHTRQWLLRDGRHDPRGSNMP